MPVYEYRCKHCGCSTDRILAHADVDAPGACPDCGEDALARRFSRVGVKLQGWGFAATDGMVPDRPGRGTYRELAERAERISEGDASSS